MDLICGDSPLWDGNLTWNTTDPELSDCFETTVLCWVPAAVFIFLASFEFRRAYRSSSSSNPFSLLHMYKQIGNVIFLASALIKLSCYAWFYSQHVPNYHISSILSGAIESFIMIVVIILTAYSKRKGIRVSNALPIFWLLQLINFVLLVYSFDTKTLTTVDKMHQVLSTVLHISGPLSVVMLFMTSYEEAGSAFQRLENGDQSAKRCPAEHNSFFAFIFFAWATKLIKHGFKGQLKLEHLDPLCGDMQSATTTEAFDKVFLPNERLQTVNIAGVEPNVRFQIPQSSNNQTKKKNILFCLWRMAWWPLAVGGLLELFSILSSFIPPYIMHLLMDFIQSDEILWHGFVYGVAFWFGSMLYTTLDALSQYFCVVASIRIKSGLISAVYRKILLLSNPAKRRYTCGEIVNLMAIDSEEVFGFTSYVYQFLGVPLRVVLTIYFLWSYIGPSCLASLAVFAFMSPLSYLIGRKIEALQDLVMAKKDKRIKQMAEIVNGIKILKLYAWELPFMKQVLKTRDEELGYLRTSCYVDSFFVFLWVVAPFLTCAVCFATFLLSSSHNILDPQTAFVSLTLFNLLRFPMGILPDVLTRLVKCMVSLNRLTTFLYCEEIDIFNVSTQTDPGNSITVTNGTFTWDPEQEPNLKNINLKVPKGSLVAVVGTVGCGKSSLLSAILGEMQKISGDIGKKGRVAYVPQLAWIRNASLQKNITFKKPYVQSHYNTVIKACALQPDIELLNGGDKTEIGEKGINLSGGQKQRVSLARAVYQDEELYLLDDPLSAVDANVAAQLFKEVIGPGGMLRKKTRILATHNISYLSEMDTIVVMADGEIVEQGTYKELMENKGKFAEFLIVHTNQEKEKEEEKPDEKKKAVNRQLSAISNTSQTSEPIEEDLTTGQLTEEEGMEIGQVKWGVYKKYIQSIGTAFFLLICLFNGLSAGLETGSGLWLSNWSMESGDRHSQLLGLGIYCAFIAALAVVICLCYVVLFWGAIKAAKVIHENLLNSLMKSPLSFFDTTPSGRILNRFSKDVESIDTEIPFSLGSVLNNLFWLPTILVIITMTSSYMLPFMGLAFLIYGFILRGYVLTSNQLRRYDSVSRSPVYSNFTETIQGVSSIRAYQAQNFFVAKSHEKVDENLKCYYFRILSARWLDMSLAYVASIIILATTFICVLERGNVKVGVLGLALAYCSELTGGLSWLVKTGAMLESQIVSLERVLEYSDLPPEGVWANNTPSPNWPQNGVIRIQNYSTVYREGLDPVLKDINLNIEPGSKVGVVGRTGAGKSSFILSLFRILEPTQGQIVIDDIDITQIGTHDLRSKLTVIPQDPVLFAGSLRMNLDPWDEHTDDQVWLSLERSHLKTFVTTLPDGLEHVITEGGDNLSAGQRQLVCLARALLRSTKILILDEATASVDLDTDQLIQETVREAFNECTVITIAHRLHTIMKCDKIICFSQGRLVEQGSPSELLEDNSTHFYSMAKDAGLV